MCPLFFLSLLNFSPSDATGAEQPAIPGIAPSHTIVRKDQQPAPSWMLLWKKARAAVRDSDNRQAAEYYRQLLLEKPHIEEAIREYVLVLMHLERWQEGSSLVQQLLEFDSDSPEYQLYAGRIALVLNHFGRAAHYLGQVYSLSPHGSGSMEALKGQISALHHLGREEIAFPLMEQLYIRIPHDEKFIRNLAQSSLNLGYRDKAQTYYRVLLTELEAKADDYLESEPLFTEAGDDVMSVLCWQGYLQSHPYYLPFHRKLSEHYLQSDQQEKALSHLLVRIAHGDNSPHIFLATAKIYTYQTGRPDKALHYYEEYRKRNPSDSTIGAEIKRVQAVLADDLLVIVENDGAWPLWRDLAKVIPDRLAVYYTMAEKLQALQKDEELVEVLEIINQHNPEDSRVRFQLAHLYFGREELTASSNMLDSLPEPEQMNREYFLLRAKIAEKRGNRGIAVNYYQSYLRESPHDYPVVLEAMQLAGDGSLIEELHHFYGFLPGKGVDRAIYFKGNLLYGELLASNYLSTAARQVYQQLPGHDDLSTRESLDIELRIVETLQIEGDFFTAEELLRKILIAEDGSDEIITALIENRLEDKDWEGAWKWHELLGRLNNPSPSLNNEKEYERLIWRVEILEKSGQGEEATEEVADFLQADGSICSAGSSRCAELKARLVELYLAKQDYDEAALLLDRTVTESGESESLSLLAELVQAGAAIHGGKQPELEAPLETGGRAIDRALIYENYNLFPLALQLTRDYLQHSPTSLQGRVIHGRLLQHSGDDLAALSIFQELTSEYPEESGFRQSYLDLLFKAAEFAELVAELAPQWKEEPAGSNLLGLHSIPEGVENLVEREKLLLARTFWAVRRWKDALRLYESLLKLPVDQEFSEQLVKADVNLVLPPPKRTFWNRITFTRPVEPDRLTVVMSPAFTSEHLHEPPVSIAADLYSSYRWQQIVSRELSVRQDMKDGNYYHAMKEYQKLLDQDPSMESLFDLAGVYSRLGFSGKEMALYEIIQEISPGYPHLDESIQRNSLKRQPWLSPVFFAGEKDGREDYYDNREKGAGMRGWFMPSLQHQFSLDLQRIYNKSSEVEHSLWRNRAKADMKWSPLYDLDFQVALGADRADDNRHGTSFLYELRANGRIGDMVQGYGRVSQDVVDDTVEALDEGIKSKAYEVGFSLDFLPRLFGGYEYGFTEYSDANHQNRYGLWTSYILRSEPQLLQLRYGYEYSHNADTNKGRDFSQETGFDQQDHPYWSPKEYWQHLFTVSFEHQLAEDVLGRSAPSYYSLEYSFGYENGGYDNHQVKGQIFLEMSRHFLLNGSFDYTNGSEYEEQDVLLSLIYRW
ncbi:MAG: hypothetical protein ABFR63_00040 [Thermodesulfobacteriota bacterium]